jgi:DNA-binding PadR family transcriptional regulator
MEFMNPNVAIEVVSLLYYSTLRAAALVKQTIEATGVSEPTVYSVLTELQERGFIEKNVRSTRNVTYTLTKEGRKFLQTERFSAVDTMLSSIKSPERRREILVELLMEDMLDDLPAEWQGEDLKEALRKSMASEIDDVKKRMLRFTTNLNH